MPESPEAGLAWADAQGLVTLVAELGGFISVGSGAWVTIITYTVTTNKTFFLTDLYATEHEVVGGMQYLVDLLEGANVKLNMRGAPAAPLAEHFNTPIKFTSGQDVKLNVYQWSGANKQFRGALIGFEV